MCPRDTTPAKNHGYGHTIFSRSRPPGDHLPYRTHHEKHPQASAQSREPTTIILIYERRESTTTKSSNTGTAGSTHMESDTFLSRNPYKILDAAFSRNETWGSWKSVPLSSLFCSSSESTSSSHWRILYRQSPRPCDLTRPTSSYLPVCNRYGIIWSSYLFLILLCY